MANKQIFPSLQATIRRGHLDVPVISVAKAGWNSGRRSSPGLMTPLIKVLHQLCSTARFV